jgi:hypothetical protein
LRELLIGVTVAKDIELNDKFEDMGAQVVSKAATSPATSTTATVLACAARGTHRDRPVGSISVNGQRMIGGEITETMQKVGRYAASRSKAPGSATAAMPCSSTSPSRESCRRRHDTDET